MATCPDAPSATTSSRSAARPHAALLAIEEAAGPEDVPILDRAGGRVLAALAAGRRRIVEVGTAFGYSTLWMALAQPAGGTIVTLDPDRVADRSGPGAGGARPGSPTTRSQVINRPALEAFAAGRRRRDRRPRRAVRPRLHRRPQARVRGLPRGAPAAARAGRPDRRRQRPVERRRGRSRSTRNGAAELRAFNAAVLADPGLRRDDPAGRRRAARRDRPRPEPCRAL